MTMSYINKFEINNVHIEEYAKTHPRVGGNDPNDPQYLEGYSVLECSLTKELLKPNELAFTMRHQKATGKSLDIINQLIGKSVSCHIVTQHEGRDDTSLHFSGTIAKVTVKGAMLSCIAYSEDAKMQGSAKCRSFCGKTLSQIVNAVVDNDTYHIEKRIQIQTGFDTLTLPYIVQYNESDYDFLVRLAKRFGAFFYYDQYKGVKELHFGKIVGSDQIDWDLNDTPNAKAASYELLAENPNFRYSTHFDEQNTDLVSPVPNLSILGSQGLLGKAVAGSSPTKNDYAKFIDYPNRLPQSLDEEKLKQYSESVLRSMSDNMAICKFISYNLEIHVGSIVKIDANTPLLVIAVHITWDIKGSPQNEVTAIVLPKNTVEKDKLFAPYMDINAFPKSSAMRAVVVNNIDEKKLGRVQVRFAWQPEDMSDDEKKLLPWIRIAQPYGGGKKDKDKGQGFYILPEEGEEVMVGFEHQNIEKPFVIGTLYHDASKAEQVQMPEQSWVEEGDTNKKNEVKAFRTKKGHTIEIHDVDGDDKYGFIRIYGNEKKDGPNYDIILSTDPIKDKDYTIESASLAYDEGKDNYKIDKLRVLVRSNGGDIMLDAGDGDIVMNAMNIRLHTQKDRTAYIGGKEVITVEDTHFLKTKDSGLHVKNNREVLIEEKDDYSSKNLVFGVTEDCKFSADSLSAKTKKSEINTTDLNVDASQSANITAKTSIALNSSGTAKLSAKTGLSLETNSKGELKAGTIDINGTVVTNLKGKVVNIQADLEGNRKGIWKDA